MFLCVKMIETTNRLLSKRRTIEILFFELVIILDLFLVNKAPRRRQRGQTDPKSLYK